MVFEILLQIELTWFSNFKCWSIKIPKNFVESVWFTWSDPNLRGRIVKFFLYENKMKLVFLWLTASLFAWSHKETDSSWFSTVRAMNSLSWLSKEHVKVLSSANKVKLKKGLHFGKSLMWMRNKSGPNIEPWGTPTVIGAGSEVLLLTDVYCCRFDKYDSNQRYAAPLIPYL